MSEWPDLDALRRKSAINIAELVRAEIRSGLTYCKLAECTSSPQRRERLLSHAQHTMDIANRWIWKVQIHHEDFDQLTAELDLLRLTIENMRSSRG